MTDIKKILIPVNTQSPNRTTGSLSTNALGTTPHMLSLYETLNRYVIEKQLVLNSDLVDIGFVDYNDGNGSVEVPADTWLDVTNDTLGAFTNTANMPEGVTSIIDPITGYLEFGELEIGDQIFIRIDFNVVPNTNNALLECRYLLGQGVNEYALNVFSKRMDVGAGIVYGSEKGLFLIYMGDANTLGGKAKLQIKVSSPSALFNNGLAITIVKR